MAQLKSEPHRISALMAQAPILHLSSGYRTPSRADGGNYQSPHHMLVGERGGTITSGHPIQIADAGETIVSYRP
jgi:hypothetical protein